MTLSAADACRMRLAAQFLLRPAALSPQDVVHALVAVQAQDYAGAKWGLGQRARGAVDAAIDAAVASGRILRTHVLRPTWHFVAPQDIRWLLALTGPRVSAAMASYNRRLELTPDLLRRTNDVIARSLEGGRELTRAELRDALARARVPAAGQRLAHIMLQAELDAVVCSGARRGAQFTYALLDERVPVAPRRDRDADLADLAVRYVATRGPATTQDFAWWSGLTAADAKRAMALAAPALREAEVLGRRCWIVAGLSPPRARKPRAHLLPNYDEFFIGLRDRTVVAQRAGSAALVMGGNALTAHGLFLDGQLVGSWRRAADGGRVALDIRLVARISSAERALVDAAVERLGAFLGVPAEIRRLGRGGA